MPLADQIREQLISSFRTELNEHIQTITDGLLALEQHTITGKQREATLGDIFRAAHSIKGAARAIGVTTIEQLAHTLEGVLEGVQCEAIKATEELFTACYQSLDAIEVTQAAYEMGKLTPPPQALRALADLQPFHPQEEVKKRPPSASEAKPMPQPQSRASVSSPPTDEPVEVALSPERPSWAMETEETIRVNVSKLDALMAQLSELLVAKIRAEQRLSQVRQLQKFITEWQRLWLSERRAYDRLSRHSAAIDDEAIPLPSDGMGEYNGIRKELGRDMSRLLEYVGLSQERMGEISKMINQLTQEYANDTTAMSLLIDELEEEIKQLRMLPLNTITGAFGRMVRDLAHEADKEAVLHIAGGDTELDKQVLEQIKDPLTHLLRNAVDHGIEPPEEREAQGKPRRGTISLAAEQLGQDVLIRVSDDGAGLQLDAIRKAVTRKSGNDARGLNEMELIKAIFNVGVSTKPIITDISGRGIGLDVVRRNVEALQGHIEVDWTPGAGTAFSLILPQALTSSHGLLVSVSDQVFAIPLNAIKRIIAVRPEEIISLEGYDAVRYEGQPLTLVRLGDVLELRPTKPKRKPNVTQEEAPILAVILAAAERRMAFVVDELVGEQEVVIKGLGKQLKRVGGIAGATVTGGGEIVLILNVADLIKLAMGGKRRPILDMLIKAPPTAEDRDRKQILVVDDSITTRTLEKNILEAAGYTVHLATDGQEALDTIATQGAPDLIVADVMMPRMNGFGLTQRVKDEPETAHIPVILVTSLDSEADKARGIEAGADAYIIKSRFDQSNLLETIEQLI